MKKLLFMICTVFVLNACERFSDAIEEMEEQQGETPTDLNFSVSRIVDLEGDSSETQGYETYNFLGYGYDLTGKYSHTSSVRAAVVNTPEFVQEHPDRFQPLRTTESGFKPFFAEDAEAFTGNITWLLDDSGNDSIRYFKGSITQPFPLTDPLSDKYFMVYTIYM